MLRPLFFFFLIALLFSWNPAKAQEVKEIRELPPEIHGNWASPDCGSYQEALVLTRFFHLKATKDNLYLSPAGETAQKGDYRILSIDGKKQPVRLEEDGILKIGFFAGVATSPKNWDDLKLDHQLEYAGCVDPPTVVPKMMLRLMRYVDRIRAECKISVTNDCARVLFKMTDADNNKKITPSEIKRSVATALVVSELSDQKMLTSVQIKVLANRAGEYGQKISDAMMTAQDADKSGSLDYNEAVEKFKVPEPAFVAEVLKKAGPLFPAFKAAGLSIK